MGPATCRQGLLENLTGILQVCFAWFGSDVYHVLHYSQKISGNNLFVFRRPENFMFQRLWEFAYPKKRLIKSIKRGYSRDGLCKSELKVADRFWRGFTIFSYRLLDQLWRDQ